MNRTFIEVPQFSRKWQELGLTDENLKALEEELLNDPKAGVAIQGTGGIRKIRIPMENKGKGKRGGARVIYVDIELKETIYFINVYTKDEKDDLTEEEKKISAGTVIYGIYLSIKNGSFTNAYLILNANYGKKLFSVIVS